MPFEQLMLDRPLSVVIDPTFRRIGIEIAVKLQCGGILVLAGVMALIRLQVLQLSGVMTRFGLVAIGFRFGQLFPVLGDVRFD